MIAAVWQPASEVAAGLVPDESGRSLVVAHAKRWDVVVTVRHNQRPVVTVAPSRMATPLPYRRYPLLVGMENCGVCGVTGRCRHCSMIR